MRKERKVIGIDRIHLNEGQLDWLPKNPRQWTQTDIDKTAASIIEDPDFLEDRPLLVVPFGKEFVAFGGNLRHEGCKAAKKPTAPCMVYYPETDEDYATIKRRAIKDNGSFGSWDFDELANNWDDLPLGSWGVKAWPAPENPIQGEGAPGIGGTEGSQETKKGEEDDFDEKEDGILVRCKPGDVWVLGDHRLICGDSTDLDVIKKLMGGVKADMVFTSPPYNAGTSEKLSGNTHTNGSKYIHSDDNLADYLSLIEKSTKNAMEVSKYVFINLQMLAGNKVDLCRYLYDLSENLCDVSIWYKTNTAPAMASRVMNSQFEFIFIFSKDNNSRAIGTKEFRGTVSNVFVCDPVHKNDYSNVHAATFSVPFVSNYIDKFSNEGDVILDPFGGTGTTIIAAEQMGRKACLVEIDPHYCDVILARWEKATGKKAHLAA